MNRKTLLISCLVAIPLLTLLALGFDHDPNLVDSPLLGKESSSFVLSDFDGNLLRFAELRGKPTVLNFWASWCQPCVYEHPHLVAVSRRYAGRVHFVGVVPPEDQASAVAEFQRRLGTWGPTLYDHNGKVAIAYGIFGLPETFIIDADGIIVEKVTGPIDSESLAYMLERLL